MKSVRIISTGVFLSPGLSLLASRPSAKISRVGNTSKCSVWSIGQPFPPVKHFPAVGVQSVSRGQGLCPNMSLASHVQRGKQSPAPQSPNCFTADRGLSFRKMTRAATCPRLAESLRPGTAGHPLHSTYARFLPNPVSRSIE